MSSFSEQKGWKSSVRRSVGQKSSLDIAAEKYAASMTREALAYLAQRGINETVAHTSQLGVCREPLPGHEHMRGRLTIPYLTPAGVVQIKARSLDGREPKYVGLTGMEPHLYNVLALHKDSDYIAVCEGELDALVMDQLVGVPAVGVPGVKTWQKWHYRCFAGYEKVFVLVDSDEAGQGLAEKIAHDLRDQAVLIPPPDGMDLNEWVLRDGPEAIRKACGV